VDFESHVCPAVCTMSHIFTRQAEYKPQRQSKTRRSTTLIMCSRSAPQHLSGWQVVRGKSLPTWVPRLAPKTFNCGCVQNSGLRGVAYGLMKNRPTPVNGRQGMPGTFRMSEVENFAKFQSPNARHRDAVFAFLEHCVLDGAGPGSASESLTTIVNGFVPLP
jgi:hypothetical protein